MSQTGKNQPDMQNKSVYPMLSGSDIVIRSLVNHGVTNVFAYPGGFSMPLHQALTRYRDKIRVILPRHEQGGGFAAQGFARSTGELGVCMTTSGPGATNLITAVADAKLDSIPLLAITAQVGTAAIGYDSFQETPITEVCRSITKHHYLITNVKDVARIMKEAICIATTGRPGPVLVDIPKDVLVAQCLADFDVATDLPGYQSDAPQASDAEVKTVADAIRASKRPVLYIGGGVIAAEAAAELMKLVERTQIPVTTTLMALTAFPREHHLSLGMPGMHGTAYANYAMSECDLLLGIGVRFTDRVTGKVSEFAKNAKIVHVDIDPSEIDKIKSANVAIISDAAYFLTKLNRVVMPPDADLSPWHAKIDDWKKRFPMKYETSAETIAPQQAIEALWDATRDRETIIATGVGQHQMWTAQYFKFRTPRTHLTSGGLGTMGFGFPAAMGAKIAHPDKLVINIDGDGSLQMNIQEFGTCFCEKIPIKILLLNNQHLGMVMQWEDRFHASNRGNTYLGPVDHPEAFGQGVGIGPEERYPDFCMIARGYGWQSRLVSKPDELADAMREMVESEGPFLLDVTIPYQHHVLPMIPAGGTVQDIIL